MTSVHYTKDRTKREKKIQEIGQGKIIASYLVHTDREYPYDWERQKITENGIIIIYNPYTERLVTKLIARPHQIRKLMGKKAPNTTMQKARYHESMGWNYL